MEKLEQLYEGKTKKVFKTSVPGLHLMGRKKDKLLGKELLIMRLV